MSQKKWVQHPQYLMSCLLFLFSIYHFILRDGFAHCSGYQSRTQTDRACNQLLTRLRQQLPSQRQSCPVPGGQGSKPHDTRKLAHPKEEDEWRKVSTRQMVKYQIGAHFMQYLSASMRRAPSTRVLPLPLLTTFSATLRSLSASSCVEHMRNMN